MTLGTGKTEEKTMLHVYALVCTNEKNREETLADIGKGKTEEYQ